MILGLIGNFTAFQDNGLLQDTWSNTTTVHPIGLAVLLILCGIMWILPRRDALIPFLILVCFIPSAQRIVVFSLDFTFLRIMVMAGWMRLAIRQEIIPLKWTGLDFAIIAWGVIGVVVNTIQLGNTDGLVYMLGTRFDALGIYFLFRMLLRRIEDLDRLIFAFILVSVPVALMFMVEKATHRNIFSVFGGVPPITMIRRGRLRCQGAFSHPILAGCFWAALLPYFFAFYFKSLSSRFFSFIGISSTLIIIACSSSSTPISAVGITVLGYLALPLKFHLRWIRWLTAMGMVALHFLMNHPIWHLLARVDFVGGSTGWYRYFLIDQAIHHFPEWWLVGVPDTTYWGQETYTQGLFDMTNQYILEGVIGGIWTLIAFVVMIVIAYRQIGKVWRLFLGKPYFFYLAWGTGVALFVHNMNFIGVSYFGQIIFIWYMQLAIGANLYSIYLKRKEEAPLPLVSIPPQLKEAHT